MEIAINSPDSMNIDHHEPAQSRLLSLPAELRAIIFSYALEHVCCKYPVLVWDHISIASTVGKFNKGVGILLACRTTYQDCIDLIYENAVIHMSLRGDSVGKAPEHGVSLGTYGKCSLLSRMKHIQLEISYKATSKLSIPAAVNRVRRLAKAFNKYDNLKTVDLVFFDEGSRWREDVGRTGNAADPILDAVFDLECEKVVAVSRNDAARWNMSPKKWQLMRQMSGEDGREEQFREITFDYWEHEFRWKN
jgi:hypothetical protein